MAAVGTRGARFSLSSPRAIQESRPQDLVLHGVTVFDSLTGRLVPNQRILIRDDRIVDVDPRVPLGENTSLLDAQGMYAIPGLIDAHVHLTHILYQSHMTGDEILPYFLGTGVTAVRSTGDNVPAQTLIERYAERHPDISPRIFRCSFLIGDRPPIHQDIGWSITDPALVAAFVADMAAWEVTTLKIYANCEPGVGRRVIEEEHNHDLVVTGHLNTYHTADAVRDGIDCLEHIYTVADFLRANPEDRHSVDLTTDDAHRLIDLIAERNVAVDPTLMVFWGTLFFVDVPEVIDHPDNVLMPDRLRRFWEKARPRQLETSASGPLDIRQATFSTYQTLVRMLHEAGVPILVGTDAPEPQVAPGYSLHHEMEFLVDSGLSPATVLSAATIQNARVLKQTADLGSITPGKMADLVLLEANPLEDIRNSRRIHRVIKGGTILEPQKVLAAAPAG